MSSVFMMVGAIFRSLIFGGKLEGRRLFISKFTYCRTIMPSKLYSLLTHPSKIILQKNLTPQSQSTSHDDRGLSCKTTTSSSSIQPHFQLPSIINLNHGPSALSPREASLNNPHILPRFLPLPSRLRAIRLLPRHCTVLSPAIHFY